MIIICEIKKCVLLFLFYDFGIVLYIVYVILNIRFHPLSGRLVSVYYYKLFGGYCVAAWLPCNVKLAKVISSVLPQFPYRYEHVEGDSESARQKKRESESEREREEGGRKKVKCI